MKRLPLLADDQSSPLVRAATYLAVPIVLVLVLPLLLLLVLIMYLAAMFHGAKVFVWVFTGKPEPSEPDLPRPHFLDMQTSERELPDESAPTAKD